MNENQLDELFAPPIGLKEVDNIYATCLEILQRSEEQNIPTNKAADQMVEERLTKDNNG